MSKVTAQQVEAEYAYGRAYKTQAGVYENARRNERFFIGDQWYGVNAPKDLDRPVFNILKRVVSYFVATVVSDDVAVQLSDFYGGTDAYLSAVTKQLDAVIEGAGIKEKNRDVIRNGAVDGDGCLYLYFDPERETGQAARGAISAEVIDNTNLYFGNPYCAEVERQPYLLVSVRRRAEEIRREAVRHGMSREEAEALLPQEEEDETDDRSVMLVRFWKEKRADGMTTVHMMKVSGGKIIQSDTDLSYYRYPFAWFSWDKVKNSYHGQAAVTGLLPNQIFINKLFAMSMEHVKSMAFPKVIYNRDMVAGKWNNDVGAAIAVSGDPNRAVAAGFRAPDMSAQVLQMIDKVISYTRDTMGANDVILGNITPDNTSAILAVQQSSVMPLELQRMAFYRYMEDVVRIILDIMACDYGRRLIQEESGEQAILDLSKLRGMDLRLNVDIGASSYWSELMQVQTLDNLFAKGVLTDAAEYVENIPSAYLKNKAKLLQALKERAADAEKKEDAADELSEMRN